MSKDTKPGEIVVTTITRANVVESLRELLKSQGKAMSAEMAHAVVAGYERVILDNVAAGHVVKLTGFMTLERVFKEAGEARNPGTGETIPTAAKYVPKVKLGASFKAEVNK